MSKELIVDTFSTTILLDKAEEGKEPNGFTALVQVADKVNANRRLYPHKLLKSVKKDALSRLDELTVLTDHPDMFAGASLKSQSAVVTDVKWSNKENGLVIDAEFIKNKDFYDYLLPYMKKTKQLKFSARGYGSSTYDAKTDISTINDDYVIDGWDIVLHPAVKNASSTKIEQKQSSNISKEGNKMPNENKSKVEDTNVINTVVSTLEDKHVAITKSLNDEIKAVNTELANTKSELADAKVIIEESVVTIQKLKEAVKEVAVKDSEIKTLTDQIATLKNEVYANTLKSEIAEELKDNKYAKHIKVPSHINNFADAKVYIDEATASFDSVLADANVDTKKVDTKIIDALEPKAANVESKPEFTMQDVYTNILDSACL